MIVFAVLGVFDAVVVPLGHINLTADNGFYAGMFFGIFEELLHPVHIAVVGDGQAGHAHLLGAVEEMLDGTLPIENRVLRVDVQVYESHSTKIEIIVGKRKFVIPKKRRYFCIQIA